MPPAPRLKSNQDKLDKLLAVCHVPDTFKPIRKKVAVLEKGRCRPQSYAVLSEKQKDEADMTFVTKMQ